MDCSFYGRLVFRGSVLCFHGGSHLSLLKGKKWISSSWAIKSPTGDTGVSVPQGQRSFLGWAACCSGWVLLVDHCLGPSHLIVSGWGRKISGLHRQRVSLHGMLVVVGSSESVLLVHSLMREMDPRSKEQKCFSCHLFVSRTFVNGARPLGATFLFDTDRVRVGWDSGNESIWAAFSC